MLHYYFLDLGFAFFLETFGFLDGPLTTSLRVGLEGI